MRIDLGKIALLAAIGVAAIMTACSDQLDPYWLNVILYIGIYMIAAVSLNLVTGYTGQFSLGHAGFMCVGAYAGAILTTRSMLGPQVLSLLGGSPHVVFLVALLASGLAAALAGLIVGIPTLRLRGDYLAIVTLGFGEIIRVLIQNWRYVNGALGIPGVPYYSNILWVYGSAAICIYVVTRLVHSTYGRGFLATRDDEIAAEAMGVNTTKYKVSAFVIGAFFAGIAGCLYGHTARIVSPDRFTFLQSVEIIIMVILGGLGNTFGVATAAVLLTLLKEYLRDYFRDYPFVQMILYSLLLIILMIVRPQGLLGGIDLVGLIRRRFLKQKESQA